MGAKMSSFSSDFQTLKKHLFPLYFLYELLMSLRITFSELLVSQSCETGHMIPVRL